MGGCSSNEAKPKETYMEMLYRKRTELINELKGLDPNTMEFVYRHSELVHIHLEIQRMNRVNLEQQQSTQEINDEKYKCIKKELEEIHETQKMVASMQSPPK